MPLFCFLQLPLANNNLVNSTVRALVTQHLLYSFLKQNNKNKGQCISDGYNLQPTSKCGMSMGKCLIIM